MNPYAIMFILLAVVVTCVSIYVGKRRKQLDEMHGMMVGMTFGMIAGLVAGTLYVIPTGNFLIGSIVGTICGLLFGVPFGRLGGHMGIVEGVIAGPMGGIMGAMLGQMIRPFSIDIFMPFFSFIVLIALLGISYAVHCGVSCCGQPSAKPAPVSQKFIMMWVLTSIAILGLSVILVFKTADAAQVPVQLAKNIGLTLPANLQQLVKDEFGESVLKDGYQEIDMLMTKARYSPNIITVKKGIPLRINLHADDTAGCARDIIIPDFGIRRIVSNEGIIIELMPNKEGTFKFYCSMDMAKGRIIVQ